MKASEIEVGEEYYSYGVRVLVVESRVEDRNGRRTGCMVVRLSKSTGERTGYPYFVKNRDIVYPWAIEAERNEQHKKRAAVRDALEDFIEAQMVEAGIPKVDFSKSREDRHGYTLEISSYTEDDHPYARLEGIKFHGKFATQVLDKLNRD